MLETTEPGDEYQLFEPAHTAPRRPETPTSSFITGLHEARSVDVPPGCLTTNIQVQLLQTLTGGVSVCTSVGALKKNAML